MHRKPVTGPDGHQGGRTNTYNPLEVGQLQQSVRGSGSIWQLFPTYIMARDIGGHVWQEALNLMS